MAILICILFTIFAMVMTIISSNKLKNIEENYDYSNVIEMQGTVIDIINNYDIEGGTSYSEKIELENGKQITIDIGGAPRDKIGSTVTVFTDGKYYSFTQKGIALDNSGGFFYFIIPTLLIFISIILWSINFGGKGFAFIIIFLLLFYGISDR